MLKDIKKEILTPSAYLPIFDRLKVRLRENPYLNTTDRGSISLSWLIFNQRQVVSQIIKSLKKEYYTPEKVRHVTIHKIGDKQRELYIPEWIDRIVQMALADLITLNSEPILSDSVYSFRKGRNYYQAIDRFSSYIIQNQNTPIYLVKRDIAEFGNNIKIEILLDLLVNEIKISDQYLLSLIRKMLTAHQDHNQNNGIATGSPLTPVCENIYLNSIDHKIINNFDGLYLRYGDDILFATKCYETALKAKELLATELQYLGLSFNHAKSQDVVFNSGLSDSLTKTFTPKSSIEYLGIKVFNSGQTFLSERKEKKFKNYIRNISKRAYFLNKSIHTSNIELIKAVINAINMAIQSAEFLPHYDILSINKTDKQRLKSLDKWIAKQVLIHIHGSGHDKVFKYVSYKQLRKFGLASLVVILNRNKRPKIGN